MNPIVLYQILYSLVARDGREKRLFGDCGSRAQEAFARSLAGPELPEIWFELPLAGDPWMDVHVLTSWDSVEGTDASLSGQTGIYAEALDWFKGQAPHTVKQLALSYDISSGSIDEPAVQLLRVDLGDNTPVGFLEAVGRKDLVEGYHSFSKRLPSKWYDCYVGVFPGRDKADEMPWARVECIVTNVQDDYAEDAEVLRSDLEQVGLD